MSETLGEPQSQPQSQVVDTTGYIVNQGPEYVDACFGWVNGTLYIGDVHHAVMIYGLIEQNTYTWDSLMAAKQMWGWFDITNANYAYKPYWQQDGVDPNENAKWVGDIRFSTDDAKQSYGVKTKVVQSFKQAFPWVSSWRVQKGIGSTTQKNYGQRARTQYMGENDPDDYDDYYDDF